MAAQTQMFYYTQRQSVVMFTLGTTSAITRGYQTVYAKELTITKGVDNILEFSIINQDQKPVDITGMELTARLIKVDGSETILQKTMAHILPATGITSLVITKGEISELDAQRCYYSIEVPTSIYTYPVYVAANGGGRGVLNITEGTYPAFVESTSVNIPSHAVAPSTFVSGVAYLPDITNFTVQTKFTNFTGSVVIQGSVSPDFSTFYPISLVSHTAVNGSVSQFVEGCHPYIRLSITNTGTPDAVNPLILSGDINSILVR